MDDFAISTSIASLAVIIFYVYGMLPVLKIFILCTVILLLLYLLLMTDSAFPSDSIYQYLHPNNSILAHPKNENSHDHDDQITKKLRELSTHIVQDFILSWYRTVSDDVTFVQNAFEVFEHIFVHSRKKISDMDKEKLLDLIISEFMEHAISYKKAVEKVDLKFANRTKTEWRNHQITILFTENISEHPAMGDYPASETKYLRGIALLLLKEVLPENYSVSDTPLYLVRELIMQNVLFGLVEMICDPLFVMDFIKDILSDESSESVEKDNTQTPCDENPSSDSVPSGNTDNLQPTTSSTLITAEFNSSPDPSASADTDTDAQCTHIVSRQTSEDVIDNDTLEPDSSGAQSLPLTSVETPDSSVNNEDIPLPLLSTELHFAPEWNSGYTEASDRKEKLFHRIRIVDVIIMREAYDTNKKYVLYKITYTTKEEQATKGDKEVGTSQTAGKVEIVNKKHQVQRRFREFLALQERLTKNVMAKTLLSNIKGPSRMFPVPFGNMDSDYIEQRRKFLQAFLREVSSIPHVSHTKEFREFLAYECDPRIAYVTKPDTLPRFDKLFKSAIQDLLGGTTMKFTNVNSQDDNEIPVETSPKSKKGASNQSLPSMEIENVGAVAKLRNKVFGAVRNAENIKTNTSRQFAQFEPQQGVCNSLWRNPGEIDPLFEHSRGTNADGRLAMRGYGDGCVSTDEIGDKCTSEPYVLSAELILKLVCHNWNLNGGQICISALALKRYIQSYMAVQIAKLTSADAWTKYLTLLTDSLWPEGEWRTGDGTKQNWAALNTDKKNEITASVEQCLREALPDGLRYLVGDDVFNSGVAKLVCSLQDSRLNRRLFYRLLDIVLKELFHPSCPNDQRPDVTLNFVSDAPL